MTTKKKCPLGKREIAGLIKRFIKEGAYNATADTIAFYKVWALFPDEKFWRNYELGFQLNSIFWFLSEDGKAKLTVDLALFNLDIPPETKYDMKEDKVGDDIVTRKPKTTMADLLR